VYIIQLKLSSWLVLNCGEKGNLMYLSQNKPGVIMEEAGLKRDRDITLRRSMRTKIRF